MRLQVPVIAPAPAAGLDHDEEPFLSVTLLGVSTGVMLLPVATAAAGREEGAAAPLIVRGGVLRFGLSEVSGSREVVVDVRRAGRPCTDAHVTLV